MIDALRNVLLELAPWLLLGAAVSGLMHALMPAGLLQRQLSGRWGVVKAVALGVPLPLCSCGVIPAGIGLKRDGASDGAAIGFLISTPQTGVDSVLVTAGFLGWPFALFKVGAAALTGLIGGLTVHELGGEPVAIPRSAASAHAAGPWWRIALTESVDTLRMIWRWLVFGVLVSALITTLVPADALAGPAQALGPFASLLVLLISAPLYVCATASVPIAAALVHAGLPMGSALVFLMAGPATNVATMGAVYRAFGARVSAIYLGTLTVGSLVLGLGYDALFPAAEVALGHAHQHTSLWAFASALVLLALIARFAWEDTSRWVASLRTNAGTPALEISVGGMTCNGCATRLDGVLRKLDGVENVTVELDAGRAILHGAIDPNRARDAIRAAGFTPDPA